jgi:hypothetical protein
MGPIQDRFDNLLQLTTTAFLGLSHYDCLLCHDGRNHLEQVSVWGTRQTRLQAQRMAAHFARTSMIRQNLPSTNFYYRSFVVSDAAGGNYELNTNSGNRPDRRPIGDMRFLTPEYQNGTEPSSSNWREAFAFNLIEDPLFSINIANRLWKEMFTMAIIEPMDSIDPARLDPSDPPPAPWQLQPTHPALIQRLAQHLRDNGFNLREFVRTLAESSAYQLSSRYSDPWKLEYVPLFARHYPRRLEGEEIHDALVKASGMIVNYTLQDGLPSTPWAMQMPEVFEPRSNGTAINFMVAFFRGDREAQLRQQDGSIQQQLNMMNDAFVLQRTKINNSPNLRAIAALESNDAVVDEVFLTFLGRVPDARERKAAMDFLAKAGNSRNAYIEDLAWVVVNKTDFLYNY